MMFMKMHRYIFAAFGLLALVIIAIYSMNVVWVKTRMKEGNAIVQSVELFRAKYNRLPNSLSEMGLPESEAGPLYYLKEDNGKDFMVWYGTTLGESTTYYSLDKKWR